MPAVAQEALAAPRAERRIKVGPLSSPLPAAVTMLVLFVTPLAVFAVYSFLTGALFRSRAVDDRKLRGGAELRADARPRQELARRWPSCRSSDACDRPPVAYWLRYAAGRWRTLVLFLITATLFASYLVRIYAWRSILGESGLLNSGLLRLGVIDQPLGFLLYNKFSVTVALVHIFLPYVVLVLYAGFAPLPRRFSSRPRISERTRFCAGAGSSCPWLPLPLSSAFLFVFVLSAGDYVTPQLIGGTNGVLLGVEVQAQFKAVGDFPLGAATSLLMLAAFLSVMRFTRWRCA